MVFTIFLSCALSISLIKFAARRGDAKAQATLAYMYFFGAGVEKNKVRSAQWVAHAANSAVRNGITKVVNVGKGAVKKTGRSFKHILQALAFWKRPQKTPSK